MGTAYDLSIGKDTFHDLDPAINKRLNNLYRENEQRRFDSMSPKQQQAERDRRAATAFVDGPAARFDDKVNFQKYNDKKAKGDWKGMTPEESDVSDKAFRQLANENKRIENMSRAMKADQDAMGKKKGGKVCGMKKGGKVRGCGCAERGLTKGKMR